MRVGNSALIPVLLSLFDTEITNSVWLKSINANVYMIVRGVIDTGELLSFVKIVRRVESRLHYFND